MNHLAPVNTIENIDVEHMPDEQNFISYIKENSLLVINFPGAENTVADYLYRPQHHRFGKLLKKTLNQVCQRLTE